MPRKRISKAEKRRQLERIKKKYTNEVLKVIDLKTQDDRDRVLLVIERLFEENKDKIPTATVFNGRAKQAFTIPRNRTVQYFREAGKAGALVALDGSFSERGRKRSQKVPNEKEVLEAVEKKMRTVARNFLSYNTEGTINTAVRAYKQLLRQNIVSPSEFLKEYDRKFGLQRNAQNRTAVRTGVSNAVSLAEFTVIEMDDFYDKKRWITAGDVRVRPTHADQNGQVVNKNETFSNGNPYGGVEYNCRCYTEYFSGDETSFSQRT